MFAIVSILHRKFAPKVASSSSVAALFQKGIGRYVFSFLIGMAIATLFFEICEGTDCVVFKGPIIDQVDGTVFQYNAKRCVVNTIVPVDCDISKRILPFADKIADAKQANNQTFPAKIIDRQQQQQHGSVPVDALRSQDDGRGAMESGGQAAIP